LVVLVGVLVVLISEGETTMQHKTRIEPEYATVLDADNQRRQVVAFRVYCSCGFICNQARLNQLDANNDAAAHRFNVAAADNMRVQ
jgi:hypothetical protein